MTSTCPSPSICADGPEACAQVTGRHFWPSCPCLECLPLSIVSRPTAATYFAPISFNLLTRVWIVFSKCSMDIMAPCVHCLLWINDKQILCERPVELLIAVRCFSSEEELFRSFQPSPGIHQVKSHSWDRWMWMNG